MIFRVPNYYSKFKCIANNCKDNCCKAGWEIDIDDNTAKYYKNVSGAFGDKLNNSINYADGTECLKLNKDGTCPFLNSNNLCDIYINLGEEHLCQICKEHPRFYEYFDNVKEGGIGLCCEEAARIILSQKELFGTVDIEIAEDNTDNYNADLYDYLLSERAKIFDYIEQNNKNSVSSLHNKMNSILEHCYGVQENIEDEIYIEKEIKDLDDLKHNNFTTVKKIVEYINSFKSINKSWDNLLNDAIQNFDKVILKMDVLTTFNSDIYFALKNIMVYVTWRYFMKATYDIDVLSKVKFMAISFYVIEYLILYKYTVNEQVSFEDIVDIVKEYSKEVEYNEEIIEKISEDTYELKLLSVDNLKINL